MLSSLKLHSLLTKSFQGLCLCAVGLGFAFLLLWNSVIFIGASESLNVGGINDFSRFYHATLGFLNGKSLYDPNPATPAQLSETYGQQMWDLNPPHFHFLFLPLANLPIERAYLIWEFINFGALLVSLRLITRAIAPNITISQGAVVLGGLLMFTGTGLLLRSAQLSFLLLLPLTLAWIRGRDNDWRMAGLYLGLSATVKPFLLIFLPYLLFRKHFSGLRNFIGIFGGIFFLGIMTFGIQAHKDWIQTLSSVDWYWVGSNLSILGFLTRTLGESPSFALATNGTTLIVPFWIILSGVIGIFTLLTTALDNSPKATDRAFGLLLIAALLISPLGWTYYLFFVFAPLSFIVMNWWHTKGTIFQHDKICWEERARKLMLLAAIPGLIVPMYFVSSFQPHPFATISLGSIYFWSTFFLWVSLIFDWQAENRTVGLSSFFQRKIRLSPTHL